MSYTIVKDDEFYARQNENRLNAVVRHCKIGRVTNKRLDRLPEWMGMPLIPPYDPNAMLGIGTVMDHPRNCPPFISAFTMAN